MNWRKKLLLVAIVIFLIMIATGGGTAVSTNQINSIEKEKIDVVIINKGSSYQGKFTDTGMISELIDNLNKVKVKKLSRAEDQRVLDSGNVLKKESTITLYFQPDNFSWAQSIAILLSEKELYLPDLKSMQSNNYTVSYINDNDETTLKSIKAIYLLAEELTKQFPEDS